MPGPPRQLLKIFTCYLWGTHASRTKRATEPAPSREPHVLFSLSLSLAFRPYLFPSLPYTRANPFSASFPLPTATLFPSLRSLRDGIFRFRRRTATGLSTHVSFIRCRSNPPDLPATSREFCKTFHASLAASASFPPTKQRILVWIEFLMGRPLRALDSHTLQLYLSLFSSSSLP